MSARPADGEPGGRWTKHEIEAAVSAYEAMLLSQIRGQVVDKSNLLKTLTLELPSRTPGSIQRKLMNISAVLNEESVAMVEGFPPFSHYQTDLRVAVLDAFAPGSAVREELAAYSSAAVAAAQPVGTATDDVIVPPPHGTRVPKQRSSVVIQGSDLAALQDHHRRTLGSAGERWVVELERESLRRSGRSDLADKVQWAARDVGDGLGYDVMSYRPDGRVRLIEVKTTNLGPLTPFFITRWELQVSQDRAGEYSLYRVHGFLRDPRIYILDGNVKDHARLNPTVFAGVPL